jgi:trigger factor
MSDEPRPDSEPDEEGASTAVDASPPTEGAEEKQKLKQTVEIQDIGPCKKHIMVSIDRDDIDRLMNMKFKELMPDANVAGFRPGKAPRRLVVKRFEKDVAEQVKGELLLASMEQLAEDHEIAPLSQPNFDPFKVEIPKDGPLVYEFEVEVRPEFDLPNYKGLNIKRPVHTFSEAEVAEEERRILTPYAQIVPKPEGKAQIGDVITADGESKDGDRVLGTFQELTIRVEKRLAFKDGVAEKFGDEITGASAGDKRTVHITMSAASADVTLHGKVVQAVLQIKEVKKLRMPELTHDFLHHFGVHTEEQFRELILAMLNRRLEYLQRQSARRQIMEAIAVTANWELPQDLLLRQARRAMHRRIMEMRAEGLNEQEITGRIRMLQQDILAGTVISLKEHFVLQKIAETEKIDIDEDDIDDEIQRLADRQRESPRRIRAQLEKEDMMEALAAELIENKTLDVILESAIYEDVPLKKDDQTPVATVEEQAVPGEMRDPLAAPETPAEGETPPQS